MINKVLKDPECEILYSLIPKKSKINVGVVAKLYTTDGVKWISSGVGVCCGEKDHGRKSYFLRFYNLRHRVMEFEQEIFKEMEYKSVLDLFHVFQGSDGPFALSFVDRGSAQNICNFIIKTIEYSINKFNNLSVSPVPLNPQLTKVSVISEKPAPIKKSSKSQKGKLTAADIGIPMNFRHIEHVDLDPKKNMYNMGSPETQELIGVLSQMGMGDVIMNDKEACLAMKFLNKHGGLQALHTEGKSAISGPIPIRVPEEPMRTAQEVHTMTRPKRQVKKLMPPPPVPPQRPPPPPPPPLQQGRGPPPIRPQEPLPRIPINNGSRNGMPPPPPPPPALPVSPSYSSGSVPPPPPPPPPASGTTSTPAPPPPPPPITNNSNGNTSTLKKNEYQSKLPAAPLSLQQQIQNFSKEKLKKTTVNSTEKVTKPDDTKDISVNTNLANALVAELNRRRNMMNNDDETGSKSASSENDWEESQ